MTPLIASHSPLASLSCRADTGTQPDAERIAAVEAAHANWLAVQATVPGIDAHVDPDATWIVHPGMVWNNCAVRLRFKTSTVEKRLDHIVRRYRRGVGFWVSSLATPADLPDRLKARGLRCRKYFPGMYCDLMALKGSSVVPKGLSFLVLDDHDLFTAHDHPLYGPIRTPMRRFEIARLRHLNALRPRRVWDLVGMRDGVPVGACTLCASGSVMGVYGVGVLPAARHQGIGTALMRHACTFSRDQGATAAVLIASGEGYSMYTRVGFREVGQFGYWYRRLTH
jgi:GNAT superfamily N-acetyltransferase